MGRNKQVNPSVNIGIDNRIALDGIKDEWRLNIQETISALIKLWHNSSDDQKVNAIRKREPVSAA